MSNPALQWKHSHGMDLPLLHEQGQSWLVVPLLADSLQIKRANLRKTVMQLEDTGNVQTAVISSCYCMALRDLPALAGKLHGKNNKLLALKTTAAAIAEGEDEENLLTTRAQQKEASEQNRVKRRSRLEATTKAISEYIAGKCPDDIFPAWHASTKLSRNTFNKVLRGTYHDRMTAIAWAAAGGLGNAPQPAPRKPPELRKASKFTPQVIVDIRRQLRAGVSRAELATQWDTIRDVIRDIGRGCYGTKAMDEALALERGGAAQSSPKT